MFKRLARKTIHADPWLTFYLDDIEFPDGSTGTYSFVHRKDGVGIVVTTPGHKVLLQKEYRYVIEAADWEIPGGGIDDGETPEQAARRELEEESGIAVQQVELLGTFYPLNSFNTEKVTLFHAPLPETPVLQDQSEDSEVLLERALVPFEQALEMIDTGEIVDAMTAHAVQMVWRRLQRQA